MKINWQAAALMIGLGLFLGSLVGFAGAGESRANPTGKLARAYTHFGFKLFHQLLKQDFDQNLFISPASVAFALAMTYNGAGGETQAAMVRTLEIQGMSLNEVNQANAQMRQTLHTPDPQIKLSIANSIWGRKDVTFKPLFLKRNEEFYGAYVRSLDFSDPQAPGLINAWVKEKTGGMIPRIVERITPQTILFLINAIYFKGKWTRPFDKAATKEGPFLLLSGRKKPWPLMSQLGTYQYFRGKNFQGVSLPYGSKEQMSMDIFLPDQDSSLKEFYRELTPANWQSWLASFRETPGTIVLPRFKVEYGASLVESLKALGMGVAFEEAKANFSNLCSTPANVYIGEVRHKARAEVNEEGTEAAAVTIVGPAMAVKHRESFRMVVDRPFFFAIRDRQTGSLLFMGSIVEPQ